MGLKCFACDRPITGNRVAQEVDTRDGQTVYVGSECFRLVMKAGESGYQPPKGGPRLYPMPICDCQCPEPETGVALVSMECPIHNLHPHSP